MARAKSVQPAATSPQPPLAGPLSLSAGVGFDGIDDAQSGCNCLPPDGAIAAGPVTIVAAVNTAFGIWDKAGSAVAGYPKSLSSLLSNPSCLPSISDPFAEYDQIADRFMVGAVTYDASNDSSVCIAVSASGDPTATWHVYGFPIGTAGELFDFPHATIGATAIYATGNLFQGTTTFVNARVYAYDKAQMYAGQAASSAFVDVGNNAAGKPADTLTPARNIQSSTVASFIAADNSGCPCSSVSLWTWSDPFGASVFTLKGGVTVATYDQPPNALQLGGHGAKGLIATNDAGNLAAYVYGSSLYGAHTIAFNPGTGTVAAVQWYQLANVAGVPTLLQQGVVATNGGYRYFPNLSVDRVGNLALAYAFSSGTDYAGIRFAGRGVSDPPGVLGSEGVLKAGQQTIDGSRYGDYAGAALDPDGCTAWHFEEYARAGSNWGTWAGSMRASGCSTSVGGIAEEPLLPAVLGARRRSPPARTVILLGITAFSGALALYLARRRAAREPR